jgi:hypothetical protein
MQTVKIDGFESGFYDWQGISELTIPNDWGIDWAEGDYSRPEADEKFNKPEHHSGVNAVSIQTTPGHKHKAVLYRQFEVEPGKRYRASVWAMGLTHTAGDSGAGMRIGVDTKGRLDWASPGVLPGREWGQWYDQYHKKPSDTQPWKEGEWVKLSIVFTAENDTITVFLWTSCDWPKGAMAHFDDFLLEVEGDEPGPEPEPGDNGAIVEQLRRIADALEAIADGD